MAREYSFSWEWDLKSPPDRLWPLVTDTNRFNLAVGLPTVEEMLPSPDPAAGLRRIEVRLWGGLIRLVWNEEPFEWVRPYRMGVVRVYEKGPIAEMRVQLEMTPLDAGGTRLRYAIDAKPANFLGKIVLPLELGVKMPKKFEGAFRKFDEEIQAGIRADVVSTDDATKVFTPDRPTTARLGRFADQLTRAGISESIAWRLLDFVQNGGELQVARIRPYVLAEEWKEKRRKVLEACLQATRLGLLEMQWSLLCPLCRGAKDTVSNLGDIAKTIHCESCNIDYTANFDRSVEATFRPSAGVREVKVTEFCVGGPQVTPHIVAQVRLQPGKDKTIEPLLEPGRYRVRTRTIAGGMILQAAKDGATVRLERAAVDAGAGRNGGGDDAGEGTAGDNGQEVRQPALEHLTIRALPEGWLSDEPVVTTSPRLDFVNSTNEGQVFVLERTKWADTAATAAEVTVLQRFRDLFSESALRPGESVSVGTPAILFTDLKGSTAMYRDIGDATAFGRVMYHFDVLREAIDAADGSLVKTIGDAVMAVFRRPADALKAILGAQYELMQPIDGGEPLTLKAGMHMGPSIAVTLNERLDYFGSTVNMAARLEGQSSGGDVIVSDAVMEDPDVDALILRMPDAFIAEPFDTELKGFFGETFRLWRIRVNPEVLAHPDRIKESGVWTRSESRRLRSTQLLARSGSTSTAASPSSSSSS